MLGLIIGTAALLATLQLAPMTEWNNDRPWVISASAMSGTLSDLFAYNLTIFSRSHSALARLSADYVAGLVALAELLWRDDVLMCLCRAVLCALAVSVPAIALSYAIIITSATVVDTRKHVDGMRLLKCKKGLAHLRDTMRKEAGARGSGLRIAPGLMLTKFREIRGTLIKGAIGSGKTRIMLYILKSILDAIKLAPERRIRLLIHDTTGELLQGLPLADNAFAVLHGARPGGWAWAQGRDVLTKSDAEAVGDAMSPQTAQEIWGSGASVFLAAAQVKCQHELKTDWGVPEFYDNLLEDPVKLKAIYEKIYPIAASLIEIDSSTGALSKTTVSFLLTFRAAVLRYLRPLAENWRTMPAERRFSFIEWLEDSNPRQPQVVLLQRSGKYPQLSAAWIGAVIDTIAGHVNDESFSNSQTRRVFLALEELATLQKLRNFSKLVDVGRNKGLGVFASIQEIEQLMIHYGELETKTILKRFRTKIICQQVLDADTDEFSKAYIGKRTVIDETESRSRTVDKDGVSTTTANNEHEKEVPSIRGERLASDLGVFGHRVKAIVAGIEDPVELEWPVTVWPPRR
jgi:hypothetical protein